MLRLVFVAVCLTGWLSLSPCLAQEAEGPPPRIVELTPAIGDMEVSPDLDEIRVVFDRDMNTGGFSFTGGGPQFPEVTDRPQWKSKRICVLPVKLEAGKNYLLGINSPSHRNFRSADGVPLEPVVLKFRTTGGKEMTPGEENRAALVKLRELIDTQYSYREVRKVDWDAQWKKFEQPLLTVSSARDFAETAGLLLAATGDPHIWLEEDGKTIAAFIRRVDPNANFDSLQASIGEWSQPNKFIATGMVGDEIGYLNIFTWGNDVGDTDYETLFEVLRSFEDLPGLIVDVRFNSGGNELRAREFAGCFLSERALYAKHVVIDPAAEGGFTPPNERWIEPSQGRPEFRGKVAVLSGPAVMSSCEAFLLMMRQAPNAALVGGASYGSSGNPKPHQLGNGVTVFLPSWKALRPDGTPFEGEGVQPDVEVKDVEFRENDPVLEAAVRWLGEQ